MKRAALVLIFVSTALSQRLEDTFYVPLDDPAIRYHQTPNDPVARLEKRMEAGQFRTLIKDTVLAAKLRSEELSKEG